jgi:hypothetical protein
MCEIAADLTKKRASSEHLDKKPITLESYTKRAGRKAISKAQVFKLLELDSPLKDQYERCDRCNEVVWEKQHVVSGKNKLFANYCNTRMCAVCSSKKTAEMIAGYEHAFEQFKEPMFVTLTMVAVPAESLKQAIKQMQKTFASIKDVMRKKGLKLIGIRKIESNYNARRKTFNPHFHLIIDGRKEAIELVDQWYMRNDGVVYKAQKIKHADKNTLKELFKYTTKAVTGKDQKRFNAKAQDTIYRALLGIRTFQAFGSIKKKPRQIDPIEQEMNSDGWVTVKTYYWNQEQTNWKTYQTGESLYPVKLRASTKAIIKIISSSG